MRVQLSLSWAVGVGGETISPGLFRLLAAIDRSGALRPAAAEVGMSYRHAWGELGRWKALCGAPLANLARGRGATLTPLGRALVDAGEAVEKGAAPALKRLGARAAADLAQALPAPAGSPLRVAASHSLVLEQLHGKVIDLSVCGSIEALRRLHQGACDLAGFHVPAGRAGRKLAPHYLRWLAPEQQLLKVVSRTQGLMVAAGNPLHINGLADLTRPGVRFVNRQPESGTRLLLDTLLKEAGIDGAAIDGYDQPEFTHTAVASMVASSAADAGFGISAAASRFGLDFLPLATEQYYLASGPQEPDVTPLVAMLRDPGFQEELAEVSGYDLAEAGTEVAVSDLFA